MSPQTSWSLPQFMAACYRHKGRAILVFLVVMGAAGTALYVLPKEYASEAKLFVRVGRENATFDPTVTKQERIGLTATRDIEMNSIVEHLRSRSLVERVLELTQPEFQQLSPLQRDIEIRSLERRIFVDTPKASTVVVLNCEAKDPAEAQTILSKYVEVFLNEHMRVNHNSGSRKFFDEQSESLSKQIDETRAKLRDAKTEAGMASLEGQRTALEMQISAAETRVAAIEASLSANKARVASLEAALAKIPESLLGQLINGTPNDGVGVMRQSLFNLRAQEQEVLSKVTPDHPQAIALRAQVKGVEKTLEDATADRAELSEAVLMKDAAEAKSLNAELTEVQAQLVKLRDRLSKLNRIEGTIETLVADLKRQEARYQVYEEHMEEARMDEALHADRITNVNIIQPATLVATPIRPRPTAVFVLAFVTAILCSCGIVMLSEMGAHPTYDSSEFMELARQNGNGNGNGNGSARSRLKPTPK